jgi:hypothetical protein
MTNSFHTLRHTGNDRAAFNGVSCKFIKPIRPMNLRNLKPAGHRMSWFDRLIERLLQPVDPHQLG